MRAWLTVAGFRVSRAIAPVHRLVPERWRTALTRTTAPPSPIAPAPPSTAHPRLLIAPVNSAGQGTQWARAVERDLPGAFAISMAFGAAGSPFAFAADQQVALADYRWSARWARAQRDAVTGGYSHVLLESGRAPFGDASGVSVRRQIEGLRRRGIAVALVFHGSDIRRPSAHRDRQPDSPFGDPGWTQSALFELRSRENAALAARLALPVYVTTPDLLLDLPDARWLPVVVAPEPWAAADRPALVRPRPVVVHAPSSGRLKGSAIIDPVLRRLEGEGLIEYRRVEGVPSAGMPEIYREADVVIDQILLGSYGAAAVEAMHARRLVVAHVSDQSREVIRGRTGAEVPIVEAVPATLEAVMREIAADPRGFAGRLDAGARFAADVHGGGYSVEVLRDFLGR